MWKQAENKWDKIGEVLNFKPRKFYEGDKWFPAGEYDYVFEVEDESGFPKKLPFNEDDNPLVVAEKYCIREGLKKLYIE